MCLPRSALHRNWPRGHRVDFNAYAVQRERFEERGFGFRTPRRCGCERSRKVQSPAREECRGPRRIQRTAVLPPTPHGSTLTFARRPRPGRPPIAVELLAHPDSTWVTQQARKVPRELQDLDLPIEFLIRSRPPDLDVPIVRISVVDGLINEHRPAAWFVRCSPRPWLPPALKDTDGFQQCHRTACESSLRTIRTAQAAHVHVGLAALLSDCVTRPSRLASTRPSPETLRRS